MLGAPCSPCCTPVPRCSGISGYNATFKPTSNQQILSRSVVTTIDINPSANCGGSTTDKWAAFAFSCFILIPADSPAILTLTGQVPDQDSYVFFGVTPDDSTQSGYWLDRVGALGALCQTGAILGEYRFPTFSGEYVESRINVPRQFADTPGPSCSSLIAVDQTVTVPQQTDATWYGVTFFKHSNWRGFGIRGYQAHSITATLSW